MSKGTNGAEIKLSGQWNHFGVLLHIESLSDPQHLSLCLEKNYRIDCSEISSVDKTGLQLLHAWLQCISFRGAKHELINLPEGMQQAIKQLGLDACFEDYFSQDN